MEASHQLILLGAALVLLSIFAGLFSARFGAPLLLVFLGLGMIAGEDGARRHPVQRLPGRLSDRLGRARRDPVRRRAARRARCGPARAVGPR
ncbi:MAG: hypothetical protein WDO24_28220 [Pseudomonadota bacterium]